MNARAQHAPEMLRQANIAQKIATRMMIKEEQFVERAISIGKRSVFENHTFQFSVDSDGFRNIAVMALQIAENAQFEIDHEVHSPLPVAEEEEESGYTGRIKATAFSAETRNKQALQLRVIRHTHSKKTAHLARALKRTVVRMRSIDAAVRKAKAPTFQLEKPTFKAVIETLDGLLKEVELVANEPEPPKLPSE